MSCKENNDKSKNCQDGECIFPFIPHRTYCDVKNKEPVDHCVPHKKNGKAICATEVNKGVMKKYGYCDKKIKSISDEDIPPKKSRKELSEKIEKLEVGKIDDKHDTKNRIDPLLTLKCLVRKPSPKEFQNPLQNSLPLA